ncbi:MAG: tRNA lysidine(34) synthetase TilS [Acidimicrobiales bacterium]
MTGFGHLLRRCSFPSPGTPVTCAWSGGADSTALVVLAGAAGCVVSAVHVDHGIRPDRADDVAAVRAMAEQLAVPVRVVEVAVDDGPDLENRARQARHGVLPPDTLLGHTADDQAETVLLHLLRGAGPDGLGAMAHDGRRPLLDLRRSETEQLCAELGLATADDPSNHDPRFRRNRVRSEVLPLLADVFERDPVPVLTRAAGQQREIGDLLDQLADRLDVTDTRALQHEHPALVRHGLRQWLRRETGATYGADSAAVDRVVAVVEHRSRATDVGHGWRVSRHDGRLLVQQQPGTAPQPHLDLASPP